MGRGDRSEAWGTFSTGWMWSSRAAYVSLLPHKPLLLFTHSSSFSAFFQISARYTMPTVPACSQPRLVSKVHLQLQAAPPSAAHNEEDDSAA